MDFVLSAGALPEGTVSRWIIHIMQDEDDAEHLFHRTIIFLS